MTEEKTISHLESKAWYRALKVFYIYLAIICYTMAVSSIYVYSSSIYENYQRYSKEQGTYLKQQKELQIKQKEEIQKINDYGKAQDKTVEEIATAVANYKTTYAT